MLREMELFNEKQHYLLLNKDIPIARFYVNEALDAAVVVEQFSSVPAWIDNLGVFIGDRRPPKHRQHIKKLLEMSGCNTLKGFLGVTHALSLADTFWVKAEDSNLQWSDVSLFTHSFNDVIAKTAFDGGMHGYELSTTSPEYGTDGTFAKCWVRENDTIKMLKRGSSGARNAGLEPYSEFYAHQLVGAFTNDCVSYDLRSTSGKLCSVCDCFTTEELGFLPYAAVERGASDLLSILGKMRELGFEEEAKRMFVIDSVIMNEDRHKGNFGFLVNNDKQSIEEMAPLFDHNLSLLPYAEEEDFMPDSEYLAERGPKIGNAWVPIAAECLTSETRKALVNLSDFKFKRHSKYNLPEWRLEALENLIHRNIRAILEF